MEVALGFLAVYGLIYLGMLLVAIAIHVVDGLALYTIAKRRNIRYPWMGWVPVGKLWLLGCISDQYQYVAKGQVKNKRKTMLILSVVSYALLVVALVVYIVMIVGMIGSTASGAVQPDTMMAGFSVGFLGYFVMCFVAGALGIWLSVLMYMAYYDVFQSCDPQNAVLYLVLGIVVGGVVMTVFLFICRNKDVGMPAPSEQVPEQRPVMQ